MYAIVKTSQMLEKQTWSISIKCAHKQIIGLRLSDHLYKYQPNEYSTGENVLVKLDERIRHLTQDGLSLKRGCMLGKLFLN